MHTAVVIPAFNEEQSIALVIGAIPRSQVADIIVVDNGSSDATREVAGRAGAVVVQEPRRGYGNACLAGIARAGECGAEVIVFLDGDFSDYPEDLPDVLGPIVNGRADLVIGSRALGERESGALLPQARLGNWLATRLIRLFWGVRFTDLGPFRAVRLDALHAMRMEDRTYGWTVEMQIKAARLGFRCMEVPVRYRKRIGSSKVTGTLKGTLLASWKILFTIGKHLVVRT